MFSGFTCVDCDRELRVAASPLLASPRLGTNQTLYCIYSIPDNGPADITIQWYHNDLRTEHYLIWRATNWTSNSVNQAECSYYKDRLTGSTVNNLDLRHGHSITSHGNYLGGFYFCKVKVKFRRSQARWSGWSPYIVITIDCKHLSI